MVELKVYCLKAAWGIVNAAFARVNAAFRVVKALLSDCIAVPLNYNAKVRNLGMAFSVFRRFFQFSAG